MKKILTTACAVTVFSTILAGCASASRKPAQLEKKQPEFKYGSTAVPLSQDHEFIQKHPALNYWAISPYYVPQIGAKACSVASVVMLINALQVNKKFGPNAQLAVQTVYDPKGENKTIIDQMLSSQDEKVRRAGEFWKSLVLTDEGRGVTLDQLGVIIEAALKNANLDRYTVHVFHVDDAQEFTAKLQSILRVNGSYADDLIIANFDQAILTEDAGGPYGHIAPIAAFDGPKERVLVMDPDRESYEPYWVSLNTFVKAMNTHDHENHDAYRGFVWIQRPN